MARMRGSAALACVVLLAGLTACGSNVVPDGAANPEARVGPLLVSDVHVVRPPSGSYAQGSIATLDFLLQSSGQERDALVGASTPAAGRVELLLDGRSVDRVLIASGSTVTRGSQLRLFDLQERLEPGDRVSVTFRFDAAGEVTVDAPVR